MKLFVTATNTNVGKTSTIDKLIEIAAAQSLKPGVFKPIETGVKGDPNDGTLLLQKCKKYNSKLVPLNVKDIVPYRYTLPAAPYVAKGSQSIEIDTILARAEELESMCDILFIEGAGGLMVPIERDYFMIDLIKDLDAPALLVSPSELGCINQTLLSLQALKVRKIPHLWYVNLYKDRDSFFEVTYPFYRDYFGEVPLDLASVFDRYRHGDFA